MKRLHVLILPVALTLLAFALRVLHLDFQPLWWDEGYSVFFATRDLATMLDRTAVDIHPPLYYALLRLWMTFAGRSDVAVRLFSVVIGVATIPLLYALVHKLFAPAFVIASTFAPLSVNSAKQSLNRDLEIAPPQKPLRATLALHASAGVPSQRVAFLAALILALAPFHIYYSQEVRMYGLVTLLGLASVYLFVRFLEMTPGRFNTALVALAYIVVTTAALYTQYYAAFIVVGQALAILIVARVQFSPLIRASFRFDLRALWHNPRAHWLVAWFAIVLLYLPWVIYAGPKLYTYVTSKVAIEKYLPLDPITFLAQHLAAFSIGHLTAWTSLAWASVVLIALAILGLFRMTRRARVTWSPGYLVTSLFFVPLALGYLVNLLYPFHPIHSERLLLFAAPAFYLLIALGINALWNHRTIFGALAMIVVAIISALSLSDFYNVPRYPQDDYRPLNAEIQTLAQPGDIFLAIYPWQIGYLEVYYTGAPLNIVETPNDAWINNPAQMQREVAARREQSARIWLPALQTQGRILEDTLDKYLRERAYSVIDDWYGTTRLALFAFVTDPPLPRAPRDIVFEDNTTLGDVGISSEPVVAGQDIVRIRFVGETRARASTQVSFRLLDKNGTVWAQSDREIGRDLQRLGFPIPVGMPPGEYDLRVTAYRASDRAPLRIKDSPQDTTSLATVQVSVPAQPNLAALPHRLQVDFDNGIQVVGYDAPPVLHPGTPAPITLFWQTTRALDREYTIFLQIQDSQGNLFATTQAAPARGIYPTTRWQPGGIIRDPQTITLRGNTPDGDYRIAVALLDATTGARPPTRKIGTITVQGRTHYFGAPSPSNKLAAWLGEVARLDGYDMNYDQRAIRLALYWQALAMSETSYTVFVHVVDANGTIRAQGDQIPGAGAYPTTTWIKGEYLVDVYDITMPRDAPSGEYSIRIGMYDAATGARLPAFNVVNRLLGDHILLPTRITVR